MTGSGTSGPEASAPLLRVEGLTIDFPAGEGRVAVVRDVSLAVGRRELVGLVGESGSGKSLTALALLKLVPPPGRIAAGRVLLEGEDVLALSEPRLRRVRGRRIAMVFQEPATALNPVYSIGFQVAEAVRAHRPLSRRAAREEAVRLLDLVALPDPRRRLADYPHQLSGGQRQRVMIAMALAAGPDLLLADEPTTALDVTVQAQILELLERLRQELGLSVLLITHDLAVVAETCERVIVMYCGEVVEEAAVGDLFARPAHPYTRALLAALPRLGAPAARGRLPAVPGQVPDPANRPSGCAFHPRCPEVFAPCPAVVPPLYALPGGRTARCLLHDPAVVSGATA
ncbi:MAG TPA: ABC transporter ATP-binding protein [Thermoanaerobaculia bacterium]|nr:ABC transporter ATP-binding protein [Thermoanaerobaculia bacterium]